MPDLMYRFRGLKAPDTKTPKAQLDPALPVDGVATLYLYDVIDSWGGYWGVSATEFNDVLNSLGADVTEINIHINSPGGEVYEGIAILNALRNHPAKVVAHVDGLAASAASFIACGADELVMGGNTELMIHDAWGICVGAAEDMRALGDRLDKISDNIASIYAAKAGGDIAGWRAAMLAETWYSAEEAVEIGLADSVANGTGADPEEGTGASENDDPFDLSMFKYQGRAKAPEPSATRVEPTVDENDAADDIRRHRLNELRLRK